MSRIERRAWFGVLGPRCSVPPGEAAALGVTWLRRSRERFGAATAESTER